MDTKEFKEVIEEIVDVKLNKKGITKYVSAIVSSINSSDNTINVYLPPDDKNIITGLLNKTGVVLNVGDSVELCTKNGKIKNAWVALRHGDNFVAGGGGASIPIQDNPPANPHENDLWIDSSPNTSITLVRDTIPFDSIIEYDGNTVPDGYELVNTYSVTEVKTSDTWINGKPIYRKVVDMGALPNVNIKYTAHNISNLETVVKLTGMAFNPTTRNRVTLPYADSTSQYIVQLFANDTSVVLNTAYNQSAFSESFAIIEYTKTTDITLIPEVVSGDTHAGGNN